MSIAPHNRSIRRVLVTRPETEAEELAAALAARGITPVIEPLLEIRFRDAPAPELDEVQAVLCTSANGVRALARLCPQRDVPVFAVGDATARRARAEKFTRVESAGGTVEDLARLVAARLAAGHGGLLHVAGSEIAGDLAGALRAAGYSVERAVLYDARPAAALSAEAIRMLARGGIDAALFFSPRTAAVFARLAVQAGIADALHSVTAIAISRAAVAALDGVSFRECRVAARPDQAGLLAALDALLPEPCA